MSGQSLICCVFPWKATFWTFAVNKWNNDDVDITSLEQKDFDKLAQEAADLFVAEQSSA